MCVYKLNNELIKLDKFLRRFKKNCLSSSNSLISLYTSTGPLEQTIKQFFTKTRTVKAKQKLNVEYKTNNTSNASITRTSSNISNHFSNYLCSKESWPSDDEEEYSCWLQRFYSDRSTRPKRTWVQAGHDSNDLRTTKKFKLESITKIGRAFVASDLNPRAFIKSTIASSNNIHGANYKPHKEPQDENYTNVMPGYKSLYHWKHLFTTEERRQAAQALHTKKEGDIVCWHFDSTRRSNLSGELTSTIISINNELDFHLPPLPMWHETRETNADLIIEHLER